MTETPVLIVGAGPTGLVLALSLARRGIPFRIIDDNAGPGDHSRAMVVQARTLEFYDQFGFADEVIAQGVKAEHGHLRESRNGRTEEVLTFAFGDFGHGISKYPFALAYPQDYHEKFLVQKLAEAGIGIEWQTSLTYFTQNDRGVTATIAQKGGPPETIAARYLCGCDGAHSIVRKTLGIGFSGGEYPHLYFVADVKLASGFKRDLIFNIGKDTFTLLFPVGASRMQRLIGLLPEGSAHGENTRFEEIQSEQEHFIDEKIVEVNWFSTYRVHHRVADHFRIGSAFLLGDAGHLHSPIGGQGMNTGIGDAVNLGWKLAMAVRGRASETLLDSYEEERIGFARTLVATTDRAFTAVTAGGIAGETVRRVLLPLLFGLGTSIPIGQHAIFRLISQTGIQYEQSPLSEGTTGRIHGGDRLPWYSHEGSDNYAVLRSLGWQAHVYGTPSAEVQRSCVNLEIPLHAFTWSEEARSTGFERDALYLIRPDGYIAMTASANMGEMLQAYFTHVGEARDNSHLDD